MRNQIVILAAGKGTRMGNNGVLPKVLVMLKNKPLILYLLEELEKINQLLKPVVVIGYMGEKVKEILGDGFTYAVQTEQKGTAHAVEAAKGQVKAENILVLYGDMPLISAESLKKLMQLHHNNKAKVSMFTAKAPDFEGQYESLNHFGRIIRNADNHIIKITEFKDAAEEERQINEVNPGIYMFDTKWLWDNIGKVKNVNAQGEYYLTDLIEIAIKDGIQINSLPIDPKETLGVNTLEQLKICEMII